jgi:hypothetical protein
MKIYSKYKEKLEYIQTLVEDPNNSFNMTEAAVLDSYDQFTQEMLETIKELEKQTRKTEKIVYKERQRVTGGWERASTVQKDTVAIGYLDIDGELIFSKINSELFNSEDRFSRLFYTKNDNGYIVPFHPKSLILEVVDHQSKDDCPVIGYVNIKNHSVIYYDQILQE